MLTPTFFFDSHGGLHVTCDGNHPDAAAFGPLAVSRPADPVEAGLSVAPGETPWSAAKREGRLDESGEWSLLVPAGARQVARVRVYISLADIGADWRVDHPEALRRLPAGYAYSVSGNNGAWAELA